MWRIVRSTCYKLMSLNVTLKASLKDPRSLYGWMAKHVLYFGLA